MISKGQFFPIVQRNLSPFDPLRNMPDIDKIRHVPLFLDICIVLSFP